MDKRITNTLIRGSALFSKFLLIIFMTKFLSPSDVGLYGLIAGSISYFLFALGFEFYIYSNRELIGQQKKNWLPMIKQQYIFYLFTYSIVIPLSTILFFYEWLPGFLAIWFYTLLILEHLAQEVNRALVVMGYQLIASWILLLRNGGPTFSLLFMYFFPSWQVLETVFFCWLVSVFFACGIGFKIILNVEHGSLKEKIDWSWIIKGIKKAFPFLLASLSIRYIFICDRYFIDKIASKEFLGVYVLYIGIGNTILNFLDSGVISFLYPKIIAAAKSGNIIYFNKYMRELFVNILSVTLGLIVGILLLSKPLLWWINKEIYTANYNVLIIILASMLCYALSLVPQLGLYAYNNDKPNIIANIIGMLSFVISIHYDFFHFEVYVVPYSLFFTFFIIALLKMSAYLCQQYKFRAGDILRI